MKRIIALALTLMMVLSLAACGGKSDSAPSDSASSDASSSTADVKAVKLNLSVPDAESSSIGVAAAEFAKELNEKSEGRLDVKVYYNGELYGGDATAAVTTMQDGGLDMLCLATMWYASFDSAFNVINTPYLFSSIDAARAYLNDPVSQPLWDAVEGMGVKFLAAWTRSFRMTTNNIRPITCPDDFKGIKLRTPGNQMYLTFFNACGASATPMSFSEVYTALQQGTVDGQENGIALTYSMGFNEVVKYLTYLPHIYDPYIVCMSNAKWNSLPSDLQDLMQEYATKYCQYEREFNLQNDEEYLQKMVDAGLQVYYPTDEQAQQFVDATAGVEDLIRAKVGDELVDAYKDAVAAAKAE